MEEENEFNGRLLHQAALWGNAELLEDLLHGDEIHFLDAVDSLGRSALHAAATNENETCARILLQAGANPNLRCNVKGLGKTPLHVAAECGHPNIGLLLLTHGADLLAKDGAGLTALDLAEKSGHSEIMTTLRKAADEQEEKRQELYLVLWNACSKGDASQVKQVFRQLAPEAELVVNTAPNGCNTLLFKASEDGQKEIVKLLLENGADGRSHPVTKYSPLYIACYYGRKDIVEILLKKFPELIQLETVEKWLPIHAAAINGHIAVMNLLLEFSYPPELLRTFTDATSSLEYSMSFDINAKDVTQQSVLYIACYVGNHRLVELLLKFRVKAKRISKAGSPTESDQNGSDVRTIVTDAEARTSPKRKLSESLQNIMSKLNLRSSNADKETNRNEVVTCPIAVDQYCNNSSETALHVSVKNKHYNIASLLLQNGASPNLKIAATEHDLERGRDEDCSVTGSTALVEACRNRDTTMVDLLIRYGARDDECKALRVAAANKDTHVVSKLLSLKAHQDPEYKINKKSLDIAASGQMAGLGSSVTYSAMFPTTPVMINWHRQHCLQFLREQWLIDASVAHNVKLKLTPKNQAISLTAITRLDISSNELTELLPCIFQMPSLKVLNAAQNKLERLPDLDAIKCSIQSPSSPTRTFAPLKNYNNNASNVWFCPVLEEIHLQENRLDTVPSYVFELPSLVILDLSNNKLQSLPVKMWSAPKLRELNVSLNMLHDLPSMPHHQLALPTPTDSSRTLSKDSVEDILSSVESSPIHSADVLSVTSCDSKSQDGRLSVEGFTQNHLVKQDIHHHNVWSRSVEIVEALPDGSWDKNLQCQLVSLNLAHNAYEQIPPVLACCALGIARLNFSYNKLTSMGPVSHYPANLKHLDLSHNRIKSWFSVSNPEPLADLSNLGMGCYNVTDFTSTKIVRKSTSGLRALPRSLTAPGPLNICPHRRHVRLDNLRTLILADNELDKLILSLDFDDDDDDRSHDSYDNGKDSPCCGRYRSLFSNLSMLDISNNSIREIPTALSELTNLSVLNLSGNFHLTTLPPEMGLLSKLWNLNTRGCNLNDPLKSMIESKKYKTMDIIGYLKSILEDAKPYARMKLMIVGIQGIGKTSLLEQLRVEGTGTYKKKPPEHWAKRMGNRNINLKTAKGISMSTVGVDVGDWTFEKKVRGQSTHGPVTFRTWDFGGQREYYATHQYFLSKRSLYLVVWRITDGEKGINAIQQWLVNIQARAPNAPVIIVGTHYDLVKDKFPPSYSEDLQQLIREKFINIVDADKCGLPRVLDTIECSCKNRHNIKLLCSLMYDCVFGLCCPGSKERLLEQKIPATYLALEDVVGYLALERRLQGKDPVLRAEQYKMLVMHEMQQKFNIAFRDMAELNQATTFLHENGVLLHYEDATLKDLYFLDPQWLCDMLAHVVTIREINPFARNGIMKIEDLKHVFKTSQCAPGDAQMYILNLLNKFEVALTWDNRTLLIPCLLPTEEHLRAGLPGCDVRIPVRSRSWALRKSYANTKQVSAPATSSVALNLGEKKLGTDLSTALTMDRISSPIVNEPLDKELETTFTVPPYTISHQSTLEKSIVRLLLISYFPSGFWSRLMTRILADDTIVEIIRSFFTFPRDVLLDPVLASALNRKAEWICWQTGMELRYLDTTLFRLKEIQPQLGSAPCDYNHMKLLLLQEGNWNDVDIANSSILEILLPNQEVMVQKMGLDASNKKNSSLVVLKPNQACVAKLLALAVDHIDILLEDWYPTLGTRFVHTSEGKFLVTRVVPCMDCLVNHCKSEYLNYPPSSDGNDDMWQLVDVLRGLKGDICYSKELYLNSGNATKCLEPSRFPRNGANSPNLPGRRQQGSRGSTASHDSDSGVGPDSNGSSRKPSAEGRTEDLLSPQEQEVANSQGSVGCEESVIYSFMVEECILTAYEQRILKCPVHGEQLLSHISPDTIFCDLGERYLIPPDNIKKGKMLGRGAFGFVFKATVKQRGFNNLIEVAMKMLQPVEPGYGARQSDTVAYKAARSKWHRDPLQYACKAYCTARQELNILLILRHPNIVPLVGICTRPLALVLRLAPQGALDAVVRNYRRSGARLEVFVLQKIVVQIAKALEYLHQQHIIYRDLKSENVLVWELPPPFHPTNPQPNVDVKLADYGISRATLPTGTKGFGGTEGFMAPEIMRFNGEEEYTEKVDCFSFGMFMYELVTLHLPFEGQECVKDNILEGGRPSVTNREMIYPTYILDLMTLCWAQQPKDRPSASQIVSIATAPEFVHLIDVVSLQEHTTVLSATSATLPCDEDDYANQTWEVWLSRLGKQIDILSCGQHSWHEYKVLNVDAAAVTALCVVEDTVWLGDSRGSVHVYSSLPYVEIRAFSLDVECSPPLAIRNICYLKSSKKIAVTTNNGRLWLCDISLCTPKDNSDIDPVNSNDIEEEMNNLPIRELGGNGNPIFCITAVNLKESCQLWCGQTQGSVSVYKFKGDVVATQEVVYHYDPIVDNVDVTQLISGNNNGPTVWSYIYPGCVVYLWDVTNQEILQKLDCSKLVPCSESLMSISIEEHLSPGRCQVTAMAVQGSELYIGTTWGCIVVAEGNTMRPITIFRPYEEEVKVILPLARAKTKSDSQHLKDSDVPDDTTFPLIATAGKGYRNLIGRYTVLPNSDESPLRSMFLMLWQTEFWFGN